MLTSPIHPWSFVVSNVIVSVIVMSLQIVVTLFCMKKVFGIESGVPAYVLFPVLLLFGLAGIGLGGLYLNLVILVGFALAFGLVATYRFSRNNDTRMFV
ncbi:hypothetical protein [Tumebacillus flagellatus]|uniref:hypothetical protein n=1 Tax=Tumebacillus flagellatus TaxID=1157490 RepID=UPI0013765395|nr:hypothetical protein [Tumebacillus flagellatus]